MSDDDPGDMITVRFELDRATRMRRHPPEWEFYNGTTLAYFADKPIMWWPDGDRIGLRMDQPRGWSVDVTNIYPGRARMVTMRLPRSSLARELRTPYDIVDDPTDL